MTSPSDPTAATPAADPTAAPSPAAAVASGVPPLPPGKPDISLDDPHALLCGYLDHYRDAVLRKVDGLTEEELRGSSLPSGWSPLELVRHLTFVERRWLRWGFQAEQLTDPWGDWTQEDEGGDTGAGRWKVPDGMSVDEVFAAFREQCERSRAIVADAPLAARAGVGGRFATESEAPSLAWILFHLLQEYARHTGQLDVARELIDGTTGE